MHLPPVPMQTFNHEGLGTSPQYVRVPERGSLGTRLTYSQNPVPKLVWYTGTGIGARDAKNNVSEGWWSSTGLRVWGVLCEKGRARAQWQLEQKAQERGGVSVHGHG